MAIPVSSNVSTYIQPSPFPCNPSSSSTTSTHFFRLINPGPSLHTSYSCHSANQFTWSPLLPSIIPAAHSPILENNNHPFFVKFLTKQITVCQECHKQFHSENTDLPHNIILAQLERKVICNPSIGTQIMTKEPPLHYYPQLYPVSAPFVHLFTHQMLIPLSKSNRNTQRIHCLKD